MKQRGRFYEKAMLGLLHSAYNHVELSRFMDPAMWIQTFSFGRGEQLCIRGIAVPDDH
jgi:hypothetical protein